VVVVRSDEDLALPGESSKRAAVVDSIEVALEAQSKRVGVLGAEPGACAHGPCSTRGEGRRLEVFARFSNSGCLALGVEGHRGVGDAGTGHPANARADVDDEDPTGGISHRFETKMKKSGTIERSAAFTLREIPEFGLPWLGRADE
jgi:hypothetical protein